MRKNINIELLRIISIFMVIIVHIDSEFMLSCLYKSNTVLYFSSFAKICVPCFLMIMGYLYNPNKDLKSLWIKNIYRFIIPLLFFSIFYQLFEQVVINNVSLDQISLDSSLIKNGFLINSLWSSSSHLWYIYAILEIYFLYPLFRVICSDDIKFQKLQRYLIILLFIFTIVVPTIEGLFPSLSGLFSNFNYGFSYIVFYFLLGHYIKHVIPKIKANKYIVLILYFVMIVLSIICAQSFELNANKQYLYLTSFSYQSIFIAFASLFFFIFIMKLNIKYNKVISFLGDKTLIIYYVHLMFVGIIMSKIELRLLSLFEFVLYSFICAIIVYIFSLLVACLFKYITTFLKRLFKKIIKIFNIDKK